MIPSTYIERFLNALDKFVAATDTFATAYANKQQTLPVRREEPPRRPMIPLADRCPVMRIEAGRQPCQLREGHDGPHEFGPA